MFVPYEDFLLNTIISLQHTYGWYAQHDSTAAPIAVGGHNIDSVSHIVGYSDWNTCSTGGDWTEAWTDSDGVVDWSPTIIPWGLPLHCQDHISLTILLNSRGRSLRRRWETCRGREFKPHMTTRPSYIDNCFHATYATCHVTQEEGRGGGRRGT